MLHGVRFTVKKSSRATRACLLKHELQDEGRVTAFTVCGEGDSPEVCQDEGLHHLRQQHHHWPDPRSQRLQERLIADASADLDVIEGSPS